MLCHGILSSSMSLRGESTVPTPVDRQNASDFVRARYENRKCLKPARFRARGSTQPLNPTSKYGRFVAIRVRIDQDRQARAHVARAEAEFLTKDAAEMGITDEAILVGKLTDAARSPEAFGPALQRWRRQAGKRRGPSATSRTTEKRTTGLISLSVTGNLC
jgi:hypothetical protein